MPNDKGQIQKGEHLSPATEFKPGQHWRPRRPYWNREWLYEEYVTKQRGAGEIARDFGITEAAILHWLRKHEIPRRTMSEIRSLKYWGLEGETNGMYGKTGADNPHWKGGISPERQSFYCSTEWAQASRVVWQRDQATCRRCGKPGEHIHHIVSFQVEALRADPDNLVLLCKPCHHWVHSRKNKKQEWIKEAP